MSKIGDLFVKLGLKKDEFDKGMKDAKRETQSFGVDLGKLASAGKIAFAALSTMVVSFVGVIKTLSRESQSMGDAWNRTVASMKAAWTSFKTDVSNTDFTGVIQRAQNAAAAAAEYYNAKDWDFEVEQANRLIQAEMAEEIEALQEIARDQTKSNKERIKAIQDIMTKLAPVYANTIAQNQDVALKSLNAYISQATGVAADQVTEEARKAWINYIKWQGQYANRAMIDAADAVNAAKKELASAQAEYNTSAGGAGRSYGGSFVGAFGGSSAAEDRLKAAQTALAEAERKASALGVTAEYITKRAEYNNRQNDERTKQMVDDVERYLLSVAAQQRENRRLTTLMHSLEAQSMGGGGKGAEKDAKSEFDKLQEEALDYMEQVLKDDMAKLENEVAVLNKSIMLEPIEVKLPEDDALEEWAKKYLDDIQRMQDLLAEFRDVTIEGFADAVQELTDQLAGLTESNPGRIFQALLDPLAEMAIKEGEILIATGVGVEAVKEALSTLQGPAAIAAGAALVALGAAAKSGLAALAQSGGATTYASSYTGGSGSYGSQEIQTEMTVYVKGTIKGSDIVLSGQKTVNNWGR